MLKNKYGKCVRQLRYMHTHTANLQQHHFGVLQGELYNLYEAALVYKSGSTSSLFQNKYLVVQNGLFRIS